MFLEPTNNVWQLTTAKHSERLQYLKHARHLNEGLVIRERSLVAAREIVHHELFALLLLIGSIANDLLVQMQKVVRTLEAMQRRVLVA